MRGGVPCVIWRHDDDDDDDDDDDNDDDDDDNVWLLKAFPEDSVKLGDHNFHKVGSRIFIWRKYFLVRKYL